MSGEGGRRREAFDAVAAALDGSMLIVTAAAGGLRAGCLVGFSTQASIDPPRLLVCLSVRNETFRVARGADVLIAHRLAADQVALAELFGGETGDEVDKFTRCRWEEGPGGAPLLSDCTSWVAGRIVARLDVGDHCGMLLDPLEARHEGRRPPLRLRHVRHIDAGHEA